MKLLHSKSILDCSDLELEIHYAETERQDSLIASLPDYDCDVMVVYEDSYHKEKIPPKLFESNLKNYQEFIQNLHGKKLVILEFGIGWRNQMIKAPLMQLAAVEPQARYITFNKGEIYIPEEIKEKSIGVDGNLTVALKEIRKGRID